MSELKTNLQEILQEKQDKIIPENIKKDIQIFDVIGTYEGSGGGIDTSSDNPITADDVAQGKEGFVNGEKITGTLNDGRNAFSVIATNPTQIVPDGGNDDLTLVYTNLANNNIHTRAMNPTRLPCVIDENSVSMMFVSHSSLASAIGLTPEKIKAGETILGITGTYTGEDDISL